MVLEQGIGLRRDWGRFGLQEEEPPSEQPPEQHGGGRALRTHVRGHKTGMVLTRLVERH